MLFVTFPRSGHHLLVDILTEYQPSLTYCEFYGCCNTYPCVHKSTLQKNHDFALDLVPGPDEIVVVQHRRAVDKALQSWRELLQAAGADGSQCTREFYDRWAAKWLGRGYREIAYEDLCGSPVATASGVLSLLGIKADLQRLSEIIGRKDVRERRA